MSVCYENNATYANENLEYICYEWTLLTDGEPPVPAM